MKESTRMAFTKAIFSSGNNILFKIGFLIALDFSISKKAYSFWM